MALENRYSRVRSIKMHELLLLRAGGKLDALAIVNARKETAL